jgi:hypothetical protein
MTVQSTIFHCNNGKFIYIIQTYDTDWDQYYNGVRWAMCRTLTAWRLRIRGLWCARAQALLYINGNKAQDSLDPYLNCGYQLPYFGNLVC